MLTLLGTNCDLVICRYHKVMVSSSDRCFVVRCGCPRNVKRFRCAALTRWCVEFPHTEAVEFPVSMHRRSGVSIFHTSVEKSMETPQHRCVETGNSTSSMQETPVHCAQAYFALVAYWSVESMDRCIYTFVAFHAQSFSYFHILRFPPHYKDRTCDAESRNWVVRGSWASFKVIGNSTVQ